MTIDEDVAQQIKALMRERGTGFKETVNELLRRGLRSDTAPTPYVSPVFSSEVRPGVDLDRATALAAALEDDELVRKVDLGK